MARCGPSSTQLWDAVRNGHKTATQDAFILLRRIALNWPMPVAWQEVQRKCIEVLEEAVGGEV